MELPHRRACRPLHNCAVLAKFASFVGGDGLFVDRDDVIRLKLQHPDIDAALEIGVGYIIRDNILVSTIPVLARAARQAIAS